MQNIPHSIALQLIQNPAARPSFSVSMLRRILVATRVDQITQEARSKVKRTIDEVKSRMTYNETETITNYYLQKELLRLNANFKLQTSSEKNFREEKQRGARSRVSRSTTIRGNECKNTWEDQSRGSLNFRTRVCRELAENKGAKRETGVFRVRRKFVKARSPFTSYVKV
ncbi:hypothetical protein K0M31_014463 [Melipona bicolor]|uniref:Uncharacterized protein n=1 Tax=Melipona bicolor TaxID=60889 RepID=A0AA40G8V4_9HYME|nr:hypothetical protein K0M31_014463 [Melipona bicolor]